MTKKILLIAFLSVLFFPLAAAADSMDQEWDSILHSAESLFKAMKGRQYPAIWASLSAVSKKGIVDSVYKASLKSGVAYSKEQIGTDFAIGGLVSRSYWNSYLNEFDPDMVLEESKWSTGFVRNGKAEIKIQYKKSEKPALLQMFKEDRAWKVGLEETFEGRKYLLFQ
jgi:hypothetical protein